jgi:streptogramin lyase
MGFPRRVALWLVLAFALLAQPVGAVATPTITEFPLSAPSHEPLGITAGPDGNLWFAERGGLGSVGRMTLTGEVHEFEGFTTAPSSIVAGPDGKLWFTESSAGLIGTITPGGTFNQFFLPKGEHSEPTGIAVGPDGNLWFTEAASPAAIGRITTSGVITEYSTGLTPGSKPTGIIAGPDGNLWFTESAGAGAIGRITTSGVITQYITGLTPSSEPQAITAGSDGSLWFTESANPGAIGRITTAGVITQTPIPTAGGKPTGITTADDGNVYFTELNSPGKIGIITPAGTTSEVATPTTNSQPEQIARGPDGNLWFTEMLNNGQVARLTVAPSVDGVSASNVTETSAVLRADVGPNSQPTNYHFEYGTSAGYGSQTPSASAGSGAAPVDVSAAIGGLTPATLYHVRLVATNPTGVDYGPDRTFTTSSPSASPAVGAGSTALPPVLGRTALARVLSGSIYVRAPGSSRWALLSGARDILTGSVVDARGGTVQVTTALDRGGHTQSATLWSGEFVIHQSATGNGLTTFTLAGGPRGCRAARHGARPARAARAKARPRVQSLWAKDNHGRFSTQGQDSVATVRGTYWGTVQRCGGTLTIVRQGVVSVRDIRRHRTVLVSAGHSYLARA